MGGVHEECGVFGLYARENLLAADLVMGGCWPSNTGVRRAAASW